MSMTMDLSVPSCEVCHQAIPRHLLRPSRPTPRWCAWECRTEGGHRGPTTPQPPIEPHPCLTCGEILTDSRRYCDTACRDDIEAGAPRTWRDRHGVWPDQGHAPKSKRNMRYAALHPERVAAHRAVERALAAGRMVRAEECEECTAPASDPVVGPMEAHHDDYTRPLEVRWLCGLCHDVADAKRRRRERLAMIPVPATTPEGDGPVSHQ